MINRASDDQLNIFRSFMRNTSLQDTKDVGKEVNEEGDVRRILGVDRFGQTYVCYINDGYLTIAVDVRQIKARNLSIKGL